MKVLIVDDNPDDRRLLRLTLERHGCAPVVEARDGREGYQLALAQQPEMIISDALMPGTDGFELLRMLKRHETLREIPFVFHSAVYTGLKDRDLALSLGAEAFIAKPQEPEAFWAELTTILERRRAGQARPASAPLAEEREYLRQYSGVVAAKLEEKVRELEATLAEREKAEAALRASEIRYRRLFEASKDGILILSAESGEIIDVNPFMVELLGYPAEEYLGKCLCDAGPFQGTEACATVLGDSQLRDYLRCHDLALQARDGRRVEIEYVSCSYAIGESRVIQCNIRDLTERKQAEAALRASELQRCRLQAELACAAEVQAKLLPSRYPSLDPFEFAARCLPAHQVGGDFYDWVEVAPGVVTLTLGDVMGKGMSAAMLMSTAKAALQVATLQNRPGAAVQLTERALWADLERSESFVTLFHARLDARSRTLTYVDCGHGFVFLRRADGRVEELTPRGLPLGVPRQEGFQEGELTFGPGDVLVLFSDGLIDARPELGLTQETLAGRLAGLPGAAEMLNQLLALPDLQGPPPDDLTVLVIYCKGF